MPSAKKASSKSPSKGLLNLSPSQREGEPETRLRPDVFEDFAGQTRLKEKLGVFIKAAQKRAEPLDHTLFYGPPGLGKTTIAHIIAKNMGGGLRAVSGPAIRRIGDLAALLTALNDMSVLFIDEIHRLNRDVEEYLYSAMEDFFIDIVTGEGLGAQSVRFQLSPFTLIGATTRTGLLKAPFRDRFGIVERLDFYDTKSLCAVVERSAGILKTETDKPAAEEIARRSRGTPRIANRLLKRIRDYGEVKGQKRIDKELACYGLKELGVSEQGLTAFDREILRLIHETFSGGPVGIETLAAVLNEEPDTLEDFHEPYLLREGLLQKTHRGRALTEKGRAALHNSAGAYKG